METVERNATAGLRAAQDQARERPHRPLAALSELQEALGLDEAPLRIECFDVSNLQGTNVVASMVVFEDGLARKTSTAGSPSRGTDGRTTPPGCARWSAGASPATSRSAARPAARRGPTRRGAGGRQPARPRAGRSTPRPGGRAASPTRRSWWWSTADRRRSPPRRPRWTTSASTTSRSAGWPSGWRRSGCPGEEDPVILPRTSEGLYLLQRVRDEAHRFAITYHRQQAQQDA